MPPFGNFKKGILNIGMSPTQEEDRKGKPWQGVVGRRLEREYERLGIDLFEDCLNVNAVRCRVVDKEGNDREPTSEEINSCRASIIKVIMERKPKVIMAFGNTAINCLLGHRWKKDLGGITKWRGWVIPDRDFNAWLCPVWHPSFVVERDEREVQIIWKQDLERALSTHNKPFPKYEDEKSQVEIVSSSDRLIELLREIKGLIAVDIETNSLKGYSKESKIISFAFCNSEKSAFSFLLPEDEKVLYEIKRVLRNPNIPKIAHNMKFEHTWIQNKLGYEVRNWKWDTMLASHILDNRQGITGLKFLTYVTFGIVDYDSEISSYLQPVDSKNGNSLNRIDRLLESSEGKRQLLLYNGLDTIFTYRLAIKQMKEIEYDEEN
jgi:DNA polymerase